jgi:ParB-like chromosome segregation protein Spo0J
VFNPAGDGREARRRAVTNLRKPSADSPTILLIECPLTKPTAGNQTPASLLRKAQAMITIAPRTGAAKKSALVALDQIDFPANARPTYADKVSELVSSIRLIGLQTLPTVVERNGRYMLVAGRHRIEALRVIGKETVPVRIVDFNDIEARLWTISENLHRNELNALDRAEQIAEFVRLSEEVRKDARAGVDGKPSAPHPQAAQLAHPEKRYEQRGDSLAAREHGLSRDEVRRARTIAALPSVVKDRARSLGVDGNQSALIAAARAPTPQAQVETLEQAVRPAAPIAPRPSPLRNLENLEAGNFARWVKETTPNDRLRVIDMLERAAAILRDEMQAERAA